MPGIASMIPFQVRFLFRRLSNYGTAHFCPVCGSHVRAFNTFRGRPSAQCPNCGALERHRIVWLLMQSKTNLLDGKPKRMLHIAPEGELMPKFQRVPNLDYLTADLMDPKAMVKMDITDIQYPDATFDIIYCSHVLEHVPDDRKAMREFLRVLKPDGWALLLVPVTRDATFEDPSVVTPEERLRVFGQEDHVRRYGPDIIDRLRESGFNVQDLTSDQIATADDVKRMGLQGRNILYLCRH